MKCFFTLSILAVLAAAFSVQGQPRELPLSAPPENVTVTAPRLPDAVIEDFVMSSAAPSPMYRIDPATLQAQRGAIVSEMKKSLAGR